MNAPTPAPDDVPRRLADLRISYESGTLEPADLPANPLDAFGQWFQAAAATGMPEPNAMVLATADADGQPSARTVLLKQADRRGFAFYTNLTSRKGRELAANQRAACVFAWLPLQRQVCVVGRATPIDRDEVAEYFTSRPRDSQLGAWVSRQSTVIADREVLHERFETIQQRFADADVPVPEFWGGWLIEPDSVEFWQGRVSRLHDRLRFRRTVAEAGMDDASGWSLERLSP